ncbi:toxin-antitoxin system HicB family antitoxin [Sphingomonas gilva]|uniref:Toxin-antitoxin system HicB family antitoxin n=1 Tax=Sphingomonas gilva TaxID=2305907 RepID=A0A396RLI4_9SPHN|nr:toxin-antitoxin system HicB family antitoxin [Sphingomonas gilva]RHW17039.1 toxin-antitoxin system HicB family antitoxin [Sphingomonas gilva]
MTTPAIYQLRLPRSIKQAVERYAKQDGISMNQFMATAVAEKLSALESARFFEERYERMNLEKFDEIMSRKRGVPPREDDVIG